MQITILGSGGFQTIPRPLCNCNICKEARKKGIPYSRNGPSIYIKEIKSVVDTPKDIINSVNREKIKDIKHFFFTHWHPDHTEGMRIFEEITSDWSRKRPFKLRNHGEPINVIAPLSIINQLKEISGPRGSYFDFFEKKNFIKITNLEYNKIHKINGIKIIPIEMISSPKLNVCSYLFWEGNKKVLYMPCDVKPFREHDYFDNLDLLIINSPFLTSKEGLLDIPEDHPLRKELFSMQELVNLIKKYNIKNTLIVHIEEMWRLSFDELKEIEKRYIQYGISFAYDGQEINIKK